MFAAVERARRGLILLAGGSTLMLAGCGDDSTPPEPEPEVATIRVTVGTAVVDINATTWVQTPGPITLRVNQANQVSFRFLGADGQDEPVIVAERANLTLNLTNLTAGWTFAATGGSGATFNTTITPTTTGSSFLPLLVLHNSEHGHDEISHTISVAVMQ
jgi:hypothetical protein